MQAFSVYLAVAIAAAYSGWQFMPAALRSRLLRRIGALARRRGLAPERVAWLEAKLMSGGACGSCDTCNACGAGKSADERRVIHLVAAGVRPPET